MGGIRNSERGDPGRPGSGTGRSASTLIRDAVSMVWAAAPWSVVTTVALQVFVGVAAAAQLLLTRSLLEVVLATEAGSVLGESWVLLAGLVAVTSAMGFAGVAQSNVNLVLTEAVSRRAIRIVLDVATAVEPEMYEASGFHDTLERARTNAMTRPVAVVAGLTGILGATLSAAGVAVAALALDPVLVPIAALAAAPAWPAYRLNSRRHHRFMRAQTTDDRRRSYLAHVLSNRDLAKELRVYDMAPELSRRHDALHADRQQRVSALVIRQVITSAAAAVLGALGLLAALAFLFWSIDRGRIDLASAGTALFALLFLGQRLRGLTASSARLYEASLFLDDVAEFTDLAPRSAPADHDPEGLRSFDELIARDLAFSYPGEATQAVRGVSLALRRGEIVALVGENGSGKSTVAKLLAGIFTADRGDVLVDDERIDSVERLRRSVGVVFQDFARFALSAQDNIGLGAPGRMDDMSSMTVAAEQAGADEVIDVLDRGWQQLLGKIYPEGTDLSGGQWQRLALARALFRDAPLLIMDEPSSALDPVAESRLLTRIREVSADRAVLFISHRFSSVRLADRIYVLHDGLVVEEGTHDELFALGGRYAEMYSLQAATFGVG